MLMATAVCCNTMACEGDSVKTQKSRFTLGGYGEAVMTRNFYSQSFNRYNAPERYADDKSHGDSTYLTSISIWDMTLARDGQLELR